MATSYSYSIAADFSSGVNPRSLHDTIVNDAGITKNLLSINALDDVVELSFSATLTVSEITILDGLVSAHQGLETPDMLVITNGDYGTSYTIEAQQSQSRTVIMPDADTNILGDDTAQTITNKTINASDNTITINTSQVTEDPSNQYYTETKVAANSAVTLNTAKVSADGTINTHSDVNITAAANGSVLMLQSNEWINKMLSSLDITNFNSATDTRADARIAAQKGQNDGLATLDATGKVPASQLALSNVVYVGTWNASTNSPQLSDGSGTQGNYYVVNVDGSTSLNGITDWKVGDWAIFNGTAWEKVDNTDQVSSVAGRTGAIELVLNDNTDVAVTSVGDGELLVWDDASSNWINKTLAEASVSAVGHVHSTTDITSGTFNNARISESNVTQHTGAINHDTLLNYVPDKHVAHSTVSITAGVGLTGGGNITASRTLDLDLNSLSTVAMGSGDLVVFVDSSDSNAPKKASLTQLGKVINHTDLLNIGINTHAQIDSHIANTSNPHSVTKAQVGLGDVENVKNNYSANVPPDVNNDSGSGYSVGSIWVDASTKEAYFALDVSPGSAVWALVTTESTDDIVEGLSNLYYTEARVSANTNVSANTAKVSADGSINTHSDVTVTSAVNGDLLNWDNVSGQWRNISTSAINHNTLLNYDADEHVAHSSILITGGVGLTGGGSIAASQTLNLDLNSLPTVAMGSGDLIAFLDSSDSNAPKKASLAQLGNVIDHGDLLNSGTNSHAQIDSHIADTNNPHSVTKAQLGLSDVENVKNNYSATSGPTASDDSNLGYSIGSNWFDTTSDNAYVAMDVTSGAAIWFKITTKSTSDVTEGSNLYYTDSRADSRITAQKGQSNGLATLDATGKVPASQLALSNVVYVGTWNASTNLPLLSDGSGTQGNYYVVDTDGSTSLNGITDWKVGDWVIFNGTAWEKVDNTDQVSSVAGRKGAVVLALNDNTDVLVNSATDGQLLVWDNASSNWINKTFLDAGLGDVVGPSGSTNNAVAIFDSTTGKLIKESPFTINSQGDLTGVKSIKISSSSTTLGFLGGSGNTILLLDNGGEIKSSTANYETLVVDNNSLTNKKYVDDKIIAEAPVYGTQYHYAESNVQSSTTSETFQTKVTLSTSSLPAGNYRLGYSYEAANEDSKDETDCEVVMDGVVVAESRIKGNQNYDYPSLGGFVRLTLSGIKTATIRYRDTGSGTALIRRARLELWRVP